MSGARSHGGKVGAKRLTSGFRRGRSGVSPGRTPIAAGKPQKANVEFSHGPGGRAVALGQQRIVILAPERRRAYDSPIRSRPDEGSTRTRESRPVEPPQRCGTSPPTGVSNERDPQAGRPARRVPGAEDGRRRSRPVRGESCRTPFAASPAFASLAASGGVRRPSTLRRFRRSQTLPPLVGAVEIGRAHDVPRWRRLPRLRPARLPTPRLSGRGRRVRGRGSVASRRTTPRPLSPRWARALATRTSHPAFTSTPYRRRSSRRRRGPVPSGSSVRGSGARHPQVGPTRRRARPASESFSWQTKC